jgi:hypothetical protein
MAIDSDKLKATDILVESIKLLFAISTLFFGGLLTYRSSITEPINIRLCDIALLSFALSSIFSVLNINSLIGKIFRSESDAIKETEVKVLNVLSMLALLLGMALGAIFLSSQKNKSEDNKSSSVEQTVISDSQIILGKNIQQANIEVTKDNNSHISKVIISPK